MKRLVSLLVVAALADLGTTWYGLEVVGLVEANPMAATYHARHGMLGLVAVSIFGIGLLVGMAAALKRIEMPLSRELAIGALGLAVAVNLFAAFHNLQLIL